MPPEALVRLADPGPQIEAEALREIYFGLRAAVEGSADAISATLDLDEQKVGTTFFVELPEAYAGPTGRTIEAVDLAVRLGWVVAELEEAELPSGGVRIDIDTFLPPSERGLKIESVEIGSLKVWFKEHEQSVKEWVATLAAVGSLMGVNANDALSTALHDHGPQPNVPQLSQEATQALEKQAGSLPGGSTVKTIIRLPDGTSIETEMRRES